jgi:cell division septal protein FtsQ
VFGRFVRYGILSESTFLEKLDLAAKKKNQRRRIRPREHVLKAAARAVVRRRTRRRRVASAIGVAVGLASLVVLAGWGGRLAWRKLFTENEFFQIRQVEITTDGTLGTAMIQEFAGVQAGENLFAVRPNAIRDQLLSVAVIANAQVGRRLPDTLIIEISERVAVARLGRPGAGSSLAVDATGHVLGPGSVRAGLPVILGVRDAGLRPGNVVRDPMLGEALVVLELCNQALLRRELSVLTVDVGDEDLICVGLRSGEEVLLSRDKVEEKLRQLPIIMAVARSKGLNLAVYDMTVDHNYVGRPAATGEGSR